MTRSQANAGSARLEAAGIAHCIRVAIAAAGGWDYRLELDPEQLLTGVQLTAIIDAATAAGRTVSCRIVELGIT